MDIEKTIEEAKKVQDEVNRAQKELEGLNEALMAAQVAMEQQERMG